MTSNNVSDAAVIPDLLQQLPEDEVLESLTGDGAYDTQPVHEEVIKRGGIPIIPPRKNARIRKGKAFVHRNAAIAAFRRLGRSIWKRWIGYHRCSLVETKMNCIKRLGERLMSRTFEDKWANCTFEQPSCIDLQSWGLGELGLKSIDATTPPCT